jgi:hypothetical protein
MRSIILWRREFFMAERLNPVRVARVIGPGGEAIGPEDLPEHADIRWVRRRKARVVAAVRGGLLSLHDALQRYSLSLEEFIEWEREVGREVAERRRTGRMRELSLVGHRKSRRRSN